MPREDMISATGVVTELQPGGTFKVDIGQGHFITAKPSGKLRQNFIKITVGDKVDVEITPYDLKKGRIIWRHK